MGEKRHFSAEFKARIYLPLIEEQIDHEKFYNVISPILPQDWRKGAKAYFDEANRNESNVCDMLKELCCQKNALFIDTTESLRNAVKEGVFPYWSYDTHPNFDGHEIVTKTMLEELRKAQLLPSSEISGGSGE
jgi:hypothetical protein